MVRGDSMEKKKSLFTRILSAVGHFLLSIPRGIKNWFVNKYKAIKKYFTNLCDKEYRRLKKMNTEVLLRVAYNSEIIKKKAKEIVRKKNKERGEKIHQNFEPQSY